MDKALITVLLLIGSLHAQILPPILQAPPAGGGGGSLAFAQHTQNSLGTSPIAKAFASNVGAHHLIIVAAEGAAAPSTPTDTLGLTYSTAVTTNETLAPGFATIFYACDSGTGGADTVSVGIVNGGVIAIFEVSGNATTSCLDKTSGKINSGVTSFTSNATATTTSANELWFGFLFNDNTANQFTATGAWVGNTLEVFSGNTGFYMTTMAQIVSSTGTCTATGTVAASSFGTAQCATFH